ncbi:MAG: hypothetical protein ACR2NO_10435 [Chloroflexota bacterium]
MTTNKSSLEEEPGRDAWLRGVKFYVEAARFLSRAETIDALRRAQAAFSAAGVDDVAARCAALRRQVEAGGIDELPPASALLRR